MKVLFKNITKYTKENCDNFLEFHSKKYGKKELIKLTVTIICVLYIMIFNIINVNWIFLLIVIFLGIMIFFLEKKKYVKEKKDKRKII